MKIFNVQPVQVNEFIFNPELLSTSAISQCYQSGFDFEFDLLNSFTIIFEIYHTVGDDFADELIPGDQPNEFTVGIGAECGGGQILLSYHCSCQFNYENEGLTADLLSLNTFLDGFYRHVKTLLNQAGFESLKEKEEIIRLRHPLKETAIQIIENLRGNNLYEF
ncbi:hypothetical protein [Pedobacter rhizosphaerae]|uniref:Uncharacterized protein n=1 Tax=Pedobacter rhizosphaerae TaxID=390241 RepID=A0A1H9SH01_9SPHI|nr:hypothetical protein [Pedobacter rhizosphaerae]SER84244.1 hypothetical protein SAMN04488023_11816 [Pedobacter rhizosphaerae]